MVSGPEDDQIARSMVEHFRQKAARQRADEERRRDDEWDAETERLVAERKRQERRNERMAREFPGYSLTCLAFTPWARALWKPPSVVVRKAAAVGRSCGGYQPVFSGLNPSPPPRRP